MATPQIGFPPPLLDDRPRRLPVLWNNPLGLALAKPAGVLVLADNWFPRSPVLTEAINYQAAQGKGELERLGIGPDGVRAVFQLESELAGLALYAKDAETGTWWSNAYGSEQFVLKVQFLSARLPGGEETRHCDLPIARHAGREQRMVVSHRTGKKTETSFRFLQRWGAYSLWEATTRYLRVHQIPLHAFEVGLAVVGDRLYADEPPFFLSRVKRDFRPKGDAIESPVYDGMAMYLQAVTAPLPDGGSVTIERPPPKRFTALLRNLERYA